jgi:hypothetical protein
MALTDIPRAASPGARLSARAVTAALSVAGGNVRVVDGRILFAQARDGRPGLREPPGGPLPLAQPSRVDELRAAKFTAYRERAAVAEARVPDPAAADVARRGRAVVAEALRRHRDAS